MANSELQGKHFNIPQHILKVISNRDNDFIKKGIISYEQLKKEKHIMDHIDNESEQYKEMGGNTYHMWLNNFLEILRNLVYRHKKNMGDAGFSNTFIKNHEKDVNNANPTHLTEEINNIINKTNKLYGI